MGLSPGRRSSITADAQNQFRPAGFYSNVVIENNTVEGGNGAAIVVTSAKDVTIRGNRLVNLLKIPPNITGGKYHVDNHAAVWLSQCYRVLCAHTVLLAPAPQITRRVVCGPGVKTVAGELVATRSHTTR